jgi:hypothetical protein
MPTTENGPGITQSFDPEQTQPLGSNARARLMHRAYSRRAFFLHHAYAYPTEQKRCRASVETLSQLPDQMNRHR